MEHYSRFNKKSVVPKKAELSVTLSDEQIYGMLEKEGYNLEDDTTWANIETILESIIDRWVQTASKKRMEKKGEVDVSIGVPLFKAIAEEYADNIETEWEEDRENSFYESVEELVEIYQYNNLKKDLEYFGEQIMDELNDILHERRLIE